MILLKIAVTILIVTTLSIIAERVSPRAAGILAGYPAGSAISLFFIGLERGAEFGGQSALYNVAGMTALLIFLYTYYRVSARAKRYAIAYGSISALIAFFAAVAVLNAIHLPPWAGLLLTSAAILGAGRLFQRIPNAQIAKRVALGPRVLLFRASLSAGIILLITGAAHWVGPDLAGLFSAFPATVFPLILIIHTTYHAEQAHTVIKNVPTGLWSLILYSLTISFVYPRIGIYWGTLASFAIATVYLLGLAAAGARLRAAQPKPPQSEPVQSRL